MKDIDTFQFYSASADKDGGDHAKLTDILSNPPIGVAYEHKLADLVITSMNPSGTEAAMLLPAVQAFMESPRQTPDETTMWDDFLFG